MATTESKKEKMRQTTLFGENVVARLSIEEASQQAGVSSATIRNWVKTGYLKQEGRGFVATESFDFFLSEVAGRDKLTTRANKSLKDSHDHAALSSEFLRKLSVNGWKENNIGDEYENSLSNSYRNKEGIYYTPPSIVIDLFRPSEGDISSSTFFDPCCGSGNFIMRAIDLGFMPENIYGFDIDPVAVELTKKRIFERTGYRSENIAIADFLEEAAAFNGLHFDYIYTNPPWGKKIPKEEKEYYGALFHTGKSIDTCSLFFFASLNCLSKGGEIGLLLPESFFNIATFESARTRSLSLNIKRLIDYEKPFKGLLTKALAIVLVNQTADHGTQSIDCESKGKTFKRSVQSFISNPKSILNLHCDCDSSDVIKHVLSIPHLTLEGRAQWGLGIVTGNNKKFSKDEPAHGHIPVFKGSDIKKDRLVDPGCYLPKDLSLYQQVAPSELFNAEMKLIYKFISSSLCFFCDTEQRYILNSANMLVPSKKMPLTGDQLCSMLNSEFLNWMFKSIFNTHKVLRSDLETLPLHTDYFTGNTHFDESSYLEFLRLEKSDHGTYRIKK